jgi:hypothetical protein
VLLEAIKDVLFEAYSSIKKRLMSTIILANSYKRTLWAGENIGYFLGNN